MKISFDFDDTLEFEEVQELAKELIQLGHDVCILTTRFKDPMMYSFGTPDLHSDLYGVAHTLGIKEINFTDFEWKYKTIDSLNIDIHIDDNYSEEVCVINHKCKARAVDYMCGRIQDTKDEVFKIIKDKDESK